MNIKKSLIRNSALTTLLLLVALPAQGGDLASTAFTYQGRLEDNGVPANDDYAFVVRLFDDVAAGVQLGPTFCEDAVEVRNGLFTLSLDFGLEFDSGQRFLDIQVLREGDCADTSGFIQLFPRQPITATPMALHALLANHAATALSTEHAEVADRATAAFRLDASDGSPTNAVLVDNAGNVRAGGGSVNVHLGNGIVVPGTPTDAEPEGGGFIQIGSTTLENVAIDNNEIMVRTNGVASTLFLNNDGGNVTISGSNAAGRVGIGTNAPATKLDVQGTMQIANAGDQADVLWLATERSWVFRQHGVGAAAALKLESIGGGGNKSFIIQTTGGVGIGRPPALNDLEVEGTASKTTSGSWLANSDAAIKTNVRTISNALAVIAKLRPVAFRYTEQYQTKHPSVKNQDYYNYIAQEFREVFPESVHDSGEDGLLQMDEYPAGVYAVAAIQELHAIVQDKTCEIDDLVERERSKDHRLGELEGRNAELQARVARLEALLEVRTSPQQAD